MSEWNRRLNRHWIKWLQVFDNSCGYCKKAIYRDVRVNAENRATIDHYLPRALGGSDKQTNLVWCCFECNQAKKNSILVDFKEVS